MSDTRRGPTSHSSSASSLDRLTAALGDRYDIGGALGSGGMATVFRARDRKHGRDVAIKVLRPELSASLAGERFLREIRIAASLHHPHILQLFDSGHADGLLYYIMPLVRGETLRTRLTRERKLPVAEAARLVHQVADALDYAHAQGVIHRDIKPENILIESGHALVADFGVGRAVSGARQADTTGTLTDAGFLVGTPSYMSPEQIDGVADLDGRADQYALACLWFEMVTGHPPFTGATYSAILRLHLLEQPPSVRQRRPEVSPGADDAFRRAAAKSPADRFPTAGEFARALSAESPPAAVAAPAPPARRRGMRWAVAAAGLVLAALAVLWAWNRGDAAISDSAVVVLPFTVGQTDSLGLAEGLVSLLSTKLDGAGELRTVDPRALLSYLGRERRPLDPDQARDVARHFQAGLYILGDVLDIAGRVTLTASLYDVRKAEPIAQATRTGAAGDVFELVDGIASELLGGWGGGQSRVTRIAAVTTHSLPALKAYLEGEGELRAARFDHAVEAFGRAGEADTSFALAWYRQSVAAEWLTQAELAREAADRALRLAQRLPDRERQLLQAMVLGRHGDPAGAERIYRVILGSHPDDIEAWIQLGELQFHNSAWRGLGTVSVSRPAWERVRFYDPEHVGAMVHLARIAAAERRLGELDSLVQRIRKIHERNAASTGVEARSELLEMEALRAFALGDTAAQRQVLAQLANATDVTVILTAWDVTSFAGNPEGSLLTTRLGTAPTRAPRVRAVAHAILAHLELGMGRRRAAWQSLDSAATIDPILALEYRAYLATHPMVGMPRDSLLMLRRALERAPIDSVVPLVRTEGSSYFREHRGADRHFRHYLLGLLESALGDSAAALRHAAELARLPGPVEYAGLGHDLAAGIRLDLAWRRGDLEAVSREMGGLRMDLWYQDALTTPFYDAVRERFLGALADDSLGRTEKAVVMLGSFGEVSPYDNAFTGFGTLARARGLARLGRTAEAARYLALGERLMSGADPEFDPLLAAARREIASHERIRQAGGDAERQGRGAATYAEP